MARRIVFSVFFLLNSCLLLAQLGQDIQPPIKGLSPAKSISQYVCEVWQKDKGLPQNNVFAITQTSEGFLWLATYEGLARFDGVQFNVFSPSNVPELKSGGIMEVYEDSRKTIWIGTNSGGLTQFKKGKFKTYTTEDGLPDNSITHILEDKAKNLWVGTRQGLCLFKDDKFKVFSARDGLSNKDITCLVQGSNETLWIGTTRGLTAYKNGKFEDYTRKIIFINKSITSIAEDKVGNLWIGTQGGLIRWNFKNQTFKTFRVEDGLSDDLISKVYCDSQGTLWIGTPGSGINRIISKYLNDEAPRFDKFTTREGLKSNSVNDILEDKEGSLWIGLNRGGLNRLKDGKFTNFTALEGLTDDVTNCVYEDRTGGIWIGTQNGGISFFNNGKFTNYNKDNGLSSNYIRSIIQDRQGDIWLASYGGGVNKLLFSKNPQKPPIEIINVEKGLSSNTARVLLERRDGSIWIGTKYGLNKIQDGKLVNFNRQNLGLSDNSITCLFEDSNLNLWIGTENGGLNCLLTNGTLAKYETQKGLANNLVFSVFEDKNRVIWVGTKGGLSRIQGQNVQSIYAKDGLAFDAVHSLQEDKFGRLWMSCNAGVFWVKKNDLDLFFANKLQKINATLYQEEDGMKSSDCAASAQPTVLKDRNGLLWYPTTQGITYIDPANLKMNTQKMPVIIKRVVADNQEFTVFDNLRFNAGTSKFEIDFASLSFIAPQKIVYRYRLIGNNYSEDWITTTNREDAFYTNLPPGKYKFLIQATNSDGIWNEEGAVIEFYLEPFFYQTYWFYILCFLLVLSLGFGIYYWRVRALEKRQIALKKGIEESTQMIRAQYQEITQQAEELATINNIVRTINQEVKFESVLQALLEQGLLLFPQSNRGIFLVYQPDNEVFKLIASHGYEDLEFSKAEFTPQEVIEYCETGLKLETDLYKLQPAINLKKLSSNYRPKSSLAMQIKTNGQVDGVMFFDNSQGFQDVQFNDIQKLTRFKEHAVSAFNKARTLQEIEIKNVQIENSYRKISDSIRYARRIQKAILSEEEKITPYFKEVFIYYEPRDIVSGDFYWFAETPPEPLYAIEETADGRRTSVFKGFADPKYILAAVDCTGHGVPGAFMTVIGNDLLNAIVMEEKISKADKILYRLDKDVKKYLKQEEEGSQSKDGMDMGLLVIDDINRTIEFAGAKNSLYFIRNNEFTEFKASIFPIGGAQIAKKVFEAYKFEYQEDDIFYLFSDGFTDQFGGPLNRKFGSKQFRELLQKISYLPFTEQKEMLASIFQEWKGDRPQTDDVMVIGIKMM
jgi:ligand-binding sensor domain-containing protein/serine phosphatase RsbU (regulator of sigma subunit)